MRTVVISEKTNAAARIAAILGRGSCSKRSVHGVPVFRVEGDGGEVDVVGLRGHVLELDYPDELNDWHRVDPKALVYAVPEKKVASRNIVSALKELVEGSDRVIIATDFDREGELIGLETVDLLGVDRGSIKRARFSALTKQEIEAAFSSLTEPDRKLAESAECRQMIDLAWGASLTRFISIASKQVGKNFLSVGRVQSPTLSLIVDRHKEIVGFEPKPYWDVSARFEKDGEFLGHHRSNPFWIEEEARRVLETCGDVKRGRVIEYEVKERDEYPPPPFNTTMLLAEANKLGISASRAMSVAEDLYTSGYISYPRTDNTVYPRSLYLKGILEKLRDSEFGREAEELLQQKQIRPSRGRVETTDHPPIYPTEAATKKQLKGDRWALYELVARRFLATVAPSSRALITKCSASIGDDVFDADGYKTIFLGWRKYYPYYRTQEYLVPELKAGEEVEVLGVGMESKETQPPARFTQGTLIQEMERLGLGTKSTRHDIVQKLYDRNYAQGNNLIPTPSGIAVAEALEKHAETITQSKMTSHLERDMDGIARGESDLAEVVEESQDMLSDVLEVMEKHRDQIGKDIRSALEAQRNIGDCPKCGGKLRFVRSKRGDDFIGCSNFPSCTTTFPKPKGALVQATDEKCPICGFPRLRIIRRGQPPVTACVDPACESNTKDSSVGKCPKCYKDLRIVYSRNGKRFLGCSGYPECQQTYPLPQKGRLQPTNESCAVCGSPLVMIRNGRGTWKFCADMNCPSRKESEAKPKRRGKKKE